MLADNSGGGTDRAILLSRHEEIIAAIEAGDAERAIARAAQIVRQI